jgi:serine/threonine-protein kinase RsbW
MNEIVPLSLRTPAEAEAVPILRLVVAAAASRAGLPYDLIEELRLLVSEAASCLLEPALTTLPGGTLRLELRPLAGGLEMTVSIDRALDRVGLATGWGWRVIEGLADSVELDIQDDRTSIELLHDLSPMDHN